MSQNNFKNDTFDWQRQKVAMIVTVKVILCIILLFAIPIFLFNPNISLGLFDFFRHDFFKTEIILSGYTFDADGLVKAINNKNLKLVKLYVRSGMDLDKPDSRGILPACEAAEKADLPIFTVLTDGAINLFGINKTDYMTPPFCSVKGNNVETLNKILKSGLSINFKNEKVNGITLMHYASAIGKAEILTYMIEQGADINISDMLGRRPIHMAAAQDNITVLYILLNAGVKVDIADQNGETPIDIAKRYGNINYVNLMERYITKKKYKNQK